MKSDRRWLAALLFAGLVLRAGYCWKFPQWGPNHSIPDLNWYETIAESIYHRGIIADPAGNPTAAREPGYPILLAATYLISGPSYRAGQAINCLFGLLTIVLVFLLGRDIFGRRTAWVAAVIATFYPQFLYYTATQERETFQTFLLAFLVWLALKAARSRSVWAWVWPGLVAGAVALTNSALLPAGVMLAPAIVYFGMRTKKDHLKGAAVYLATMMLLCSIWTVRNHRLFHRFILGINGGGAHMYIGIIVPNDVAGTDAEPAYVTSDPVVQEASKLPETERDRVFYRGAMRFIREQPARYIGVVLRSLAKLWRLYPYARAYAFHYRLIKWIGLLSDGWIIPLGFLGMFLAGRRFPETDLFLAVVFSVTFTYMLFWSIIRYRLPMMPFMILFSAYALDTFASRIEGKRA